MGISVKVRFGTNLNAFANFGSNISVKSNFGVYFRDRITSTAPIKVTLSLENWDNTINRITLNDVQLLEGMWPQIDLPVGGSLTNAAQIASHAILLSYYHYNAATHALDLTFTSVTAPERDVTVGLYGVIPYVEPNEQT